MFDHEKLEVYQLELRFVSWISDLLDEVREQKGSRIREVSDQIDRSSLSSLLNTAEGNAKRQPGLRTRYFDDARGSAFESAACLDALVAKRACTADRIRPGKEMLVSSFDCADAHEVKPNSDSGRSCSGGARGVRRGREYRVG